MASLASLGGTGKFGSLYPNVLPAPPMVDTEATPTSPTTVITIPWVLVQGLAHRRCLTSTVSPTKPGTIIPPLFPYEAEAHTGGCRACSPGLLGCREGMSIQVLRASLKLRLLFQAGCSPFPCSFHTLTPQTSEGHLLPSGNLYTSARHPRHPR